MNINNWEKINKLSSQVIDIDKNISLAIKKYGCEHEQYTNRMYAEISAIKKEIISILESD